MATERIEMASAPWGEECAQTVDDGYACRARHECRRYIEQLQRHYQAERGDSLPAGLKLSVKGSAHDFGTYYEVVATCDEDDSTALTAAYWLQDNQPEHWDTANLEFFSTVKDA